MTELAEAEWTVPIVVGVGAAVVVGGPVGLPAGTLLALAAKRWLPRVRSPAERQAALEQDQLARQLPLTAELLAACLGSCSSPAEAAAAVAASVGPPMSGRLAGAAAELALGAPPEVCWERLGADCPTLAPLARCLVRTSISGSPPAAPLIGLAQAQRETVRRAAHGRVRRAGVLATAPLGVCFLPAFILIGVVPVVIGLTSLFAKRI
ncbi:type II secretion system F family protein [Kitasatospora sp. HPMI-4]|uniref:type II secretion system F family protein n=1 Tax=Kitasatospora sp. HPMI-4 TaxID=3448443 RepID=UPI003F1D8282